MREKHQFQEQFLKDMNQKSKAGDHSSTWTTERSSNSARILQNINVLIAIFSELGIKNCSCGRKLKYSRSPTTLQKTNCDFASIPGFVIEKNSSRGPKHGVSERQVMFYKAKQILKKARQSKHGSHLTILSRWYEQEGYRKSLADHNIGEKEVMLVDHIALERHDFCSYTSWTTTERQTVGSSFECWWAPESSLTVTEFAVALK